MTILYNLGSLFLNNANFTPLQLMKDSESNESLFSANESKLKNGIVVLADSLAGNPLIEDEENILLED